MLCKTLSVGTGEFKMNYEELGKRAVELGYDGGGIWSKNNGLLPRQSIWFDPSTLHSKAGYWPDFSYPETEGAALAWIAEKIDSGFVYMAAPENEGWRVACGRTKNPSYIGSWSSVREEALLSAIKSLGLGKKDNSPTGLNKRLLDVGFRDGGCYWFTTKGHSALMEPFAGIGNAVKNKRLLYPDGSHPSTIGVATAWLRSFEKIGPTVCFYCTKECIWYADFFHTSKPAWDERQFSSELEALVEFAEWAKEAGLME